MPPQLRGVQAQVTTRSHPSRCPTPTSQHEERGQLPERAQVPSETTTMQPILSLLLAAVAAVAGHRFRSTLEVQPQKAAGEDEHY